MRRICFVISTICILAGIGLRPAFCSDAAASKEEVIYSFKGGVDGAVPLSDLALDSEGNLYGTTSQGGTTVTSRCGRAGCGTVFELKRSQGGWKEQVLYSFTGGDDGYLPVGGVIFDKAGNLYGTDGEGGSAYGGTVFKLTPNPLGGWTESTIYAFTKDGNAGYSPQANLIFDAEGNLYGTTTRDNNPLCANYGCGAVFELTPKSDGTWTEITLYEFAGSPDGGSPSSELVLVSGELYGMTGSGGTGSCVFGYLDIGGPGCGTVYKLSPSSGGGWTETVLHSFMRGEGFAIYPSGRVLFDKAGHLFGTALAGGDGYGTIFELLDTQKKGWKEEELHIFFGNPDGIRPIGGMVTDKNGDFFGVTYGIQLAEGSGTVFELEYSKVGWKERVLHRFSGTTDGLQPSAGLVSDSQSHFYGTTAAGGSRGLGTVYEIAP
jgi:uncharacterized repeat protein (TIGR03803 family)